MPEKKLVIVVHGMGVAKEDFADIWAEELYKNHGTDRFEVKGLWWEPVLDEVMDKYPLISENMANAIAKYNFPQMKDILENNIFQEVHDHIMDILGYIGLPNMSVYIRDWCFNKLDEITYDRKKETIIVAHSLGSVMIPHITWYEYIKTRGIPYLGLILTGCPLGIRSPIPGVPGPLTLLCNESDTDREKTLKNFARIWYLKGEKRLTFILNKYDIVCSDVKYPIGNKKIDIIPVRQEFTKSEKKALLKGHPDCIKEFYEGEPNPAKIVDNHDKCLYLNRQEFKDAFEALLSL